MRHPFNKQAAIWTFVAVLLAWIIAFGVGRISGEQSLPFLGSLMYGVLGLFASILTGLVVQKKKKEESKNLYDGNYGNY